MKPWPCASSLKTLSHALKLNWKETKNWGLTWKSTDYVRENSNSFFRHTTEKRSLRCVAACENFVITLNVKNYSNNGIIVFENTQLLFSAWGEPWLETENISLIFSLISRHTRYMSIIITFFLHFAEIDMVRNELHISHSRCFPTRLEWDQRPCR